MAHDVFISHSSVDKPAADAVCAALEAKGVRCWIAPRDIKPSESWAAAIVAAIRGAQIILLVFSQNAHDSEQVRREVELAASAAKQILVLCVEDSISHRALTVSTPHWLDAATPPFEAHLEKLVVQCRRLLGRPDRGPAWRDERRQVKIASIAVVIVILGVGVGVAEGFWRSSPPRSASQSELSTTTLVPTTSATQSVGVEPRAQIVQLTGSWSDDGFHRAVRDRDINIVNLYLQSGMRATTLFDGASVILYGFQGLPQNGDPVELLKTFQAAGFHVDEQLEDSYLMEKLSNAGPRSMLPMPFKSPLAPKGYDGGNGGRFVGSLLFWIVQRSTWVGTDEDNGVMKYLVDQGADCKVPLAFLDFHNMVDLPQYQLMKSCAK
ncbi:toll/interleukin-1 receptor domain-containing protein [Mycobacterium sp. EPa45]|uniref:toll/interleukin-1 receptor domain-containing protein n=1 Tax=Mycobacterium sp. EPa45 TaxID=1545728 RepID=UPI000641F811|nr:toll/interleukin-1 receptor domain-containing protein [Mycobacterium sp. EPa45]AKK26989.1 hypothetical protein AB431_10215 [Mycobacterium sp. EPa45]